MTAASVMFVTSAASLRYQTASCVPAIVCASVSVAAQGASIACSVVSDVAG